MKILLLTPPMTQLNTPYPATAYLTGFLRQQGFSCVQADPAIMLVLRLFSRPGLKLIQSKLLRKTEKKNFASTLSTFLTHFEKYFETIDAAIQFLQGSNPSLALRIVSREFFPEGPRFRVLLEGVSENDADSLHWAFGSLGIQDRAKYLTSLYLDDLADVIRDGIDSRFELSRYGEKLAASAPTFEPLNEALNSHLTLVDKFLSDIIEELVLRHEPTCVGLTVPFPGNVYGAFRIAQVVKRLRPEVQIILGGGYVNTELRSLSEPRVFDYVDYITLDDGEKPFLCILNNIFIKKNSSTFLRTFIREGGRVVLKSDPQHHDIPQRDLPAPVYDGLPLAQYLSIFEMLNPMHRIWSDGRWNKLTLAHGCYWKKCSFCDVSLDYIGRYEANRADQLVDRIETVIRETGQTGFHFVDEAAPPAVLKALAERLIARQVVITWWGNIRFEKAFTPELVRLLARSGCVAVSGGLEVASDRLLKKMQKGVSVEQVARVARAFTDVGVMVHAYLMYGFPTQTIQETIDSLERVRQLFASGCIQSAYWHRFSVTAHSPIGLHPEKFGIQIYTEPVVTFARNDLAFEDPTGCNHELLGQGLRKALYNYMHGVGFDIDIRDWFGRGRIPPTRVSPQWIERALSGESSDKVRSI